MLAMSYAFQGFDWDRGNLDKCRKHGVSRIEVENVFEGPVLIIPDDRHSVSEERLNIVGRTRAGRHVFLVATFRERDGQRLLRPISARYMHLDEVVRYEAQNPNLPQ